MPARRARVATVVALAGALAAAWLAPRPARPAPVGAGIETVRDGRHMELTVARAERAGDRERADAVVAAARTLVARYADVAAAERDGFKKFLPGIPLPVEHFTSATFARDAWLGRFDPMHPTSLVYERTPDGLRIAGVMYTAAALASSDELDGMVPLSIGRWHRHVDFCWAPLGKPEHVAPPRFGFNGTIADRAACDAAGGHFTPLIFGWMIHVWPDATGDAVWAPHAAGDMHDDAMLGGGTRTYDGLPIAPARLPSATVAAGDPQRGANVFAADCASCHGALGRDGPDAPALAGSGLSAGQVAFMVRHPHDVDAKSTMPLLPLDDHDLADVAAYVARLR